MPTSDNSPLSGLYAYDADRKDMTSSVHSKDKDASASLLRARAALTSAAANAQESRSLVESPYPSGPLASNIVTSVSAHNRSSSLLGVDLSPSAGSGAHAPPSVILASASATSLAGAGANTLSSMGVRARHEASSIMEAYRASLPTRLVASSCATPKAQQPKRYLFSSTPPPPPSLGVAANSAATASLKTADIRVSPSASLSLCAADNLSSSPPLLYDVSARPAWTGAMGGHGHKSSHRSMHREAFGHDPAAATAASASSMGLAETSSVPTSSLASTGTATGYTRAATWLGGAAATGAPGNAASVDGRGYTPRGSDTPLLSSISASVAAGISPGVSGPPVHSIASPWAGINSGSSWGTYTASTGAQQLLLNTPLSDEKMTPQASTSGLPEAALVHGTAGAGASGHNWDSRRQDLTQTRRSVSSTSIRVPSSFPTTTDAVPAPTDFFLNPAAATSSTAAMSLSGKRKSSSSSADRHSRRSSGTCTYEGSSAGSNHTNTLNESTSSAGGGGGGTGPSQSKAHAHTTSSSSVPPQSLLSDPITGTHSAVTLGRSTAANSLSSAHGRGTSSAAVTPGGGTAMSSSGTRHNTKLFLFPKTQDPMVLPSMAADGHTPLSLPNPDDLHGPSLLDASAGNDSFTSAPASESSVGLRLSSSPTAPTRHSTTSMGPATQRDESQSRPLPSVGTPSSVVSTSDNAFGTMASVSPMLSSHDMSVASHRATSGTQSDRLLSEDAARLPVTLHNSPYPQSAVLAGPSPSTTTSTMTVTTRTTTPANTTSTSATPSIGRRSPAAAHPDHAVQAATSAAWPYPPEASPTSATTTTTTTSTSGTTPSAVAVSCFSVAAGSESVSEPVVSPCSLPLSTTSPPGIHQTDVEAAAVPSLSMQTVRQHTVSARWGVLDDETATSAHLCPPLSPQSPASVGTVPFTTAGDSENDEGRRADTRMPRRSTDSPYTVSADDVACSSHYTPPDACTAQPSPCLREYSYSLPGPGSLSLPPTRQVTEDDSEPSRSAADTSLFREAINHTQAGESSRPAGAVVAEGAQAEGAERVVAAVAEGASDESIAAFFQRRRRHRPPPLFGPTSNSSPSSAAIGPTSVPAAATTEAALAICPDALHTRTPVPPSMGSSGNVSLIVPSSRVRGSEGRSTGSSSTCACEQAPPCAPPALAYNQQGQQHPQPLSDQSKKPHLPQHCDPSVPVRTSRTGGAERSSVDSTSAVSSLPTESLASTSQLPPSQGSPTPLPHRAPPTPAAMPSALVSNTTAAAAESTEGAIKSRQRRRKLAPPNLFSVASTAVASSAPPTVQAQPLPQQIYSRVHSPTSSSTTSTVPVGGVGGGSAGGHGYGGAMGTWPSSMLGSANTTPAHNHRARTHRGPLVRVSHDGRTLVVGPFRVSCEGCLTVRNVLLLNPTRIDAATSIVGPATPEMMALHSTLSGGFPLLSNMASPITSTPAACGSYHHTTTAGGAGAGTLTHPIPATGSLLSPHNVSSVHIGSVCGGGGCGSGGFLSSQAQGPAPLQAPNVRTRLLKPANGLYQSTTVSGMTSPVATPELSGLAPSHHCANASFTLQSTSFETPYSPITYAMDSCRFPGASSYTASTQPAAHIGAGGFASSVNANTALNSFLGAQSQTLGQSSNTHNNSHSGYSNTNIPTAPVAPGGPTGDVTLGIPPRSHSRGAALTGGVERATLTDDSVASSAMWSPPLSHTHRPCLVSASAAASPLAASVGGHTVNTSGFVKSSTAKFASYSGSNTSSPTIGTSSRTRRYGPTFGGSPNSSTPQRQTHPLPHQPLQAQQHYASHGSDHTKPRSASAAPHASASSHGSLTARTPLSGVPHTNLYGSVAGVTSPHSSFIEETSSSLLLPYSVVQTRLLQPTGSPQSVSALAVKAVRYDDLALCMGIGEGASAAVYVAIHRPTGRRLAVKRIDLSPLCLTLGGLITSPNSTCAGAGDGPQRTPSSLTARAGSPNRGLSLSRMRRRPVQLNARAKQLEHIVARELLVLHLTYRSPFVVKVYNAFYIKEEAALDVVMEFMHYGSLDHLMAQLEKHAKALHRRVRSAASARKLSPNSSDDARSSVTPSTTDGGSLTTSAAGDGMSPDGSGGRTLPTDAISPDPNPVATQFTSPRLNASSANSMRTPTTTGSHCLQADALMMITPLSAGPSNVSPMAESSIIGSSDGEEGIEEEETGVAERIVAVVGEQLLRGLRDMHDRGYIHRDIKPGNVLVNEHGVVKLSDFGLSQRCDARGHGIENPLFKTTQALTRVPTPLTASPVTQDTGFNLGSTGQGGHSSTPRLGNSPPLRSQLSPAWTTSSASRPRGVNASIASAPLSQSPAASSAPCASAAPPLAAAPSWSASTPALVQDHFTPSQHTTTPRLFHPSSAAVVAVPAAPPPAHGGTRNSGGDTYFSPSTPSISAGYAESGGPPDSINTTLPLMVTLSEEACSPLSKALGPQTPALQTFSAPLASARTTTTGTAAGAADGGGNGSGAGSSYNLASPSSQPLIGLAELTTPRTNAEDIDDRDSQLQCGADIKRALSTTSSSVSSSRDDNEFSDDAAGSGSDSLHCSGTDKYMSPERQRGDRHGKPSDVWAVGVTLAEFALGYYPYAIEQVTDEFERVTLMSRPVAVSGHSQKRRVPLSSLFGDFIALATIPAPEERPTAQELLEHPFFRQWTSTRPFNLKRYLAARVPVPSNAVKEQFLRKQREEAAMPNFAPSSSGTM